MVNRIKKETLVSISMLSIVILLVMIGFALNFDSIANAIDKNFISENYYIELLIGLGNTFLITLVSFIIGLLLGLIICLIEGINSQNIGALIIKKLAKAYVSIFRGTPMVVQLLIIYFVLFAFYRGNPIYVAMIAFGLNSGAYVSEILRGGITSVPKGQMEAGRSLGLSYASVMRKIIFPQAIRNALPSLGNEFIALIKETSICGFIGAVDLTLAFRKIANATFDFETVYLVMGVVYFIIVYIITLFLNLIERKLINHAKA